MYLQILCALAIGAGIYWYTEDYRNIDVWTPPEGMDELVAARIIYYMETFTQAFAAAGLPIFFRHNKDVAFGVIVAVTASMAFSVMSIVSLILLLVYWILKTIGRLVYWIFATIGRLEGFLNHQASPPRRLSKHR